jgi:hypothetical protein
MSSTAVQAAAIVAKASDTAFVQLSDAELMQMDLPALQAYSAQVSAVISNQASTVAAARVVQAQYDYLILSSQSTINGLGYEITTNSNLIIAADVRSNELVRSNVILDSSIALYNSTITGNTLTIKNADTKLSTLMTESEDIAKSLVESNKIFTSSAIHYSSLYTTFVGKDLAYQACVSNILNTSTLLSNAIITQQASYSNWQTSSAFTVARSAELSTLYLTSNAIQSTLTQYKIDEINATNNLTSTNTGIQGVSSLYATSLVNQKYYQSLSTQGGILELYTAAYSTFQTAATLSNTSPGNTVVAAAANMAQQRLSTLTVSKTQITTETTALQARVAGAVTNTYETQLQAAQAAVQQEINNINTFKAYANSSIAAVTYYSSLYETAATQVTSSMNAISTFSSFYESSIIGSNSFMRQVAIDTASIANQQSQVDAISLAISSLNDEYKSYISSYDGYIQYSTLMKQEVAKSQADLITYSSLYESTTKQVGEFTRVLTEVRKKMAENDSAIATQSTILQSETINALAYKNQIDASFNMEENSAFKYRETFVRLKLQTAQQYYDGCILQEVQATSTQNGNLKTQASGSTVTPRPININTAAINNAYTILTNISAFLNSFTSIYANYETQEKNLQNVSTSIGAQMTSFSNVTSAANAFAKDPSQGASFSNAQIDFISKQGATRQNQTNVALTQGQINSAKISFLQTYNQTFMSNEIINNESTISSFLRQGFASAIIV